ncbi:hypothetical protein M514_06692 [Trichuris suis]|uniref:Uncharacterized protein n=1 Tax=Trichuris suis TaxID=68888 RepID=A0A085NHM4_9BILA|nr:hypothetical protein M514_06692 [Trichuris suis]
MDDVARTSPQMVIKPIMDSLEIKQITYRADRRSLRPCGLTKFRKSGCTYHALLEAGDCLLRAL